MNTPKNGVKRMPLFMRRWMEEAGGKEAGVRDEDDDSSNQPRCVWGDEVLVPGDVPSGVSPPSMLSIVAALCRAQGRSRHGELSGVLRANGVPHRLLPVDFSSSKGEARGVIISTATDGDEMALCAHHDVVVPGAGAVDNGGSCAVLVRASMEGVPCVWFDFEEPVGPPSTSLYFGSALKERGKAMRFLNIECVGVGQSLTLRSGDHLSRETRSGWRAAMTGCGLEVHDVHMPPSDDTLLGWSGHEATCLCGGWLVECGFRLPMHTELDTVDLLDEWALERALAAAIAVHAFDVARF